MVSPLTRLDTLYGNQDGYGELSQKDEHRIRDTKSSSIYGEITPESAQHLIEYMNLKGKDVFYDLGSGVGKLVLHAAMVSAPKRIVGLELSSTRNNVAKKALSEAASKRWLKCKNVEFWCADIMRRRFDDATYVYTCSTAFPERFFRKLVKRLEILHPGVIFISLDEIDWRCKHFKEVDILKLDMSWQKRSPVYVYERV